MKILYFIDSLRSGGKERRLIELIKGMASNPKVEMEIVLAKEGIHYKEIYLTGIKIHYLSRKMGVKKDPRLFIDFYRIAKKFKPDIIHVWSNLVAIYAIPSKVFLKTPMINNQITNTLVHGQGLLLNHKLTFPFSDKILSNTFAGLKAYQAPKRKSHVIYNGFDFNRVKNLEDKNLIRKKFGIQTNYIVGMVASFTNKKDYESYVKAAIQVLEKRRDITFLCVGSGNYMNIKETVSDEISENILFLGNQEDVESIINICDFGVLMTSKIHLEGISNSILEFNALGKPVIATRGGGTNEIVEDESSGLLIDSGDYRSLAEKIELLVENQNLLKDLGNKARALVENKFGIDRMIAEFEQVYKDVLK